MEASPLRHHLQPPQQLPQQHQASSQQQAQASSSIFEQQAEGQCVGGALLQPSTTINSMSSNSSSSLIGHKRDSSGRPLSADSRDSHDGGNFVKLFVGSVPRTISEEEVRPMFAEHGNVLEVALIKDKRTGLQQGCCFIKYGTIEEAERAIRSLNNQRMLPGGTAPVQVRYADGERERLGAVEHKLFVGSLNKQATEKEIQELFAPYGRVDDVYIMRDEQKQSRGCAFIKYPTKEMANAAITALNGVYVMPGCDQPLAVRFADPKRPKGSDTRVGGPGFGGPGFSPRLGAGGNRSAPAPMGAGQLGGRGLPGGWRPIGGPGMGPQTQIGPGYGGGLGPRGGPGTVPSPMGAPLSIPAVAMNGHPQGPLHLPGQLVGPGMLPPAQQPGYFTPAAQRQPQTYGQQAASQQQAYAQLSSLQQQPQQQTAQPQQLLALQPQLQQSLQLAQVQSASQPQHAQQLQPPLQLQPQHQLQAQQQLSQQQQQTLLQPVVQQTQQQQIQHQPQVFYQVPTIQPSQQPASWLLPVQSQAVPSLAPPSAPSTCEWTEHTSPEGYKYYYNSSTGESKWEKPDELITYEQQQQQQLQPLTVTAPQYSGAAVIAHPIQGLSYAQPQSVNGSVDQPRQQGPPGANLFVFRIPDDFTDQTLKETFTPFGNVVNARVGVERESGRNRGFGFVSYDTVSSAEAAIQGLNNASIGGRRVKVLRKRGEQNGDQSFTP